MLRHVLRAHLVHCCCKAHCNRAGAAHRRFREWKAFTIWRMGVCQRKSASSSGSLGQALFALNPILRRALMQVR